LKNYFCEVVASSLRKYVDKNPSEKEHHIIAAANIYAQVDYEMDMEKALSIS
jgi:hypothetical protein